MQGQRRKVDWSELPQELLEKIADHIDSGIELLKFRAVCKKWRSSYTSPVSIYLLNPHFPRRIPTRSSIFNHPCRSMLVVNSAVYLIKPLRSPPNSIFPKSWVVSLEELNSGKLRIRHPLTRNPIKELPKKFRKSLDLSGLRATQIGGGFRLCLSNGDENVFGFESFWPCNEYPIKHKVVMFDDADPAVPDGRSFMVLMLDQGGSLGSLKSNGKWKFINYGPGLRFDDIVNFRGQICGIDRDGTAYLIDGSESRVIKEISEAFICYDTDRRKLLANFNENLMMIVTEENKLCVYMLNEEQHFWHKVKSLGSWILFVTFDGCFFVDAGKIPGCRGNCILFPKDCFSLCPDTEMCKRASKYLEVGVFYMDEDHIKPLVSEPGLSKAFWPPPSWLVFGSDSLTCSTRVSEEDELMDSCSHFGSKSSKEFSACLQNVGDAQAAENRSSFSSRKETSQEDMSGENNKCAVPAINSPSQVLENVASPNRFEGVEVKSDLVPILHKIWDKHGNIIQGHSISSNALLTWALESLANMIIILESNTSMSLNESQAEYLNSTLVDLQLLNFKLDWLVPFVEKALALHKSKGQIVTAMELEARKSKLIAELHELEERLAEQKESLMVSAPSVLEKCLGEGLY